MEWERVWFEREGWEERGARKVDPSPLEEDLLRGLVVTAVMGKGGGEGTWLDGRGCFLLTEAVKEGQDAGPVTQYGLTAAHQLGVNAGQL